MNRSARRAGLAFLLFAVAVSLAPAAAAQQLTEKQQAFLAQYRSLLEVQDQRGIAALVQNDMRLIADAASLGLLDQYSFKFAKDGDESSLDELKSLAAAVDVREDGTRFTKRFDMLRKLTPDQRPLWMQMRVAFGNAMNVFVDARTKKDEVAYRRAIAELDDVAGQAKGLGDLEISSYCSYHVGVCWNELSEFGATITTFESAIDQWVGGGRPKIDPMYAYMVEKRRELIEKGFDPRQKDKPPPDPGATPPVERKNGTTSYREGMDWQEWGTEYREMKDPAQLPSSSPWNADHLLLWREFGWEEKEGSHNFGVLTQPAPFGKPLMIVRDGAKGFFDYDGDGKEGKGEPGCKVIDGKATLNSIKGGGEGKEAEPYAFFMLTGGQTQWFGTPVNWTGRGRYRVACYREAKVLGETVILLDDNSSGSFCDPSEQRDNLLRGYPGYVDNDGMIVGKRLLPWSDVVEIGGKWFHVKSLDPHAKKLRTRELDIETGSVVLKWNGPVPPKMLVLGEVRQFKGSYVDVAGGKPVPVPVGRWEIAYGRIETGKGAQTKQAWIFKGDAEPIEVKAGETVTLDMGAPYKFDFEAEDQGKALLVKGKSLLVKDKIGAIVGRIYDEIPYPEVAIRAKGGAAIGKPKTMARIPTEIFNKDSAWQWFPNDLTLDKPDKSVVEAQLTLKKHSMLGGPVQSEWK
jgi:hypothetical protein